MRTTTKQQQRRHHQHQQQKSLSAKFSRQVILGEEAVALRVPSSQLPQPQSHEQLAHYDQ